MRGAVGSTGSNLTPEEKPNEKKVTEQLGIVLLCGYTIGIAILCLAAAIFINCWMTSSTNKLPDIRDGSVRSNIANIISGQTTNVQFDQRGQTARGSSFWNSAFVKNGGTRTIANQFTTSCIVLSFVVIQRSIT